MCPADEEVKTCKVVAHSQDRDDCLITALESARTKIEGFQMGYMHKLHREMATDSQREWLKNTKCVQMANAPRLTKYEASVLLRLAFEGNKIRAAVSAKLKDAPSNNARRRLL